MSPIRTVLAGWRGRMGRVIGPGLASAEGIELVAQVEAEDDLVSVCRAARADVVVDFTLPTSAARNAEALLDAACHGVIGTTGLTEAELERLDVRARAVGRGLLVAPNFALGMLLMQRFAAEAVRWLPRVEIVESHHDGKVDAPSGTALRTADLLAAAGAAGRPVDTGDGADPSRGRLHRGVPIHSLRLPGLLAHQDVVFGAPGEVLTLRHDALSRECYLPGVLEAVRRIGAHVGLVRGLETLLGW